MRHTCNPSTQRWRQGDFEFEIMPHFIGSSRPALATYRELRAFLGYTGRFEATLCNIASPLSQSHTLLMEASFLGSSFPPSVLVPAGSPTENTLTSLQVLPVCRAVLGASILPSPSPPRLLLPSPSLPRLLLPSVFSQPQAAGLDHTCVLFYVGLAHSSG